MDFNQNPNSMFQAELDDGNGIDGFHKSHTITKKKVKKVKKMKKKPITNKLESSNLMENSNSGLVENDNFNSALEDQQPQNELPDLDFNPNMMDLNPV